MGSPPKMFCCLSPTIPHLVGSSSSGLSIGAASKLRLSTGLGASEEAGPLGDALSIRTTSELSVDAPAALVVDTLGHGDTVGAAAELRRQTVLSTTSAVLAECGGLAVRTAAKFSQLAGERAALATLVMRTEGDGLAILAAAVEGTSARRLSTSLKVRTTSESHIIRAAAVLRLIAGSENEDRAAGLLRSLGGCVPIRAASELGLRAVDRRVSVCRVVC